VSDREQGRRPEGQTKQELTAEAEEAGAASATPASELRYRLTQGREGTAPLDRIRAERRSVGNDVVRRMAVMRKAGGAATMRPAIPDGGSPLAGDLQKRMEGTLGADLSGARVSTSGESARAASALGARAFTVGTDVHFGAGEYAPGTAEGDKLIAHELTHVVQGQRSGIQRKASAGAEHEGEEAKVSHPDDPAEKEADEVAEQATDKLHGKKKKGEGSPGREAGKQEAPKIAAKLQPGVIPLAGKDPLRGGKKDELGTGPEANAVRVGNANQAGVQRPPQHHVLPQEGEHKAWFAARGVNVDDYCVNLDQAHHEAIHKMDWNGRIMKAMGDAEAAQKGKKLTLEQIIKVARDLMGQFQIGSLPFVKYGSERPEQ